MTSSIVITDTVRIEFNKKNKFIYKDDKFNESYEFEKEEIPAVRYRFKHYGLNEINYIKSSLKKFDYSVHIAEVMLDDPCVNEIKQLADLKEVAIFLYIDLYKDNIVSKSFSEEQRNILIKLGDSISNVERIMLKDKDNMLHMLIARPLIKSLSSLLGVKEDKVGYCSCAFSINGMCCLSAERARDIAARYSNNEHFAIATNAVEGKNIENYSGCHCIKHIVIEHDVEGLNELETTSENSLVGNMNVPVENDVEVIQLKLNNIESEDDNKKLVAEKKEKTERKVTKKLKMPHGAVRF
jgi:hypothetical protein